MTVKIVTDSTADIPPSIAEALDISTVPVYVRFGRQVYRDIIEISHDELYTKLADDPVHPTTSQPSPSDFATVYRQLLQPGDEIVSIHVSSKLSGTYNAALQGRELVEGSHIEVFDSGSLSMGLGLTVMAAARLAKAGQGLAAVLAEVRAAISQSHAFGLLDSLKYLAKGGRVGKAKALVGGLLNVKPLLVLKDGELHPFGLVRNRRRGLERLFEYVKGAPSLREVAIVYSTAPDEAQALKERLTTVIDKNRIYISQLGPALGVHGGPGTLLVALKRK
ncbi:MAG: DegV family protein [Dehalococcoidales bacterium]